jgi:hypothetical protein
MLKFIFNTRNGFVMCKKKRSAHFFTSPKILVRIRPSVVMEIGGHYQLLPNIDCFSKIDEI